MAKLHGANYRCACKVWDSGGIPLDGSVRLFRASTASIRMAPTATRTLVSFAADRWRRDLHATSGFRPVTKGDRPEGVRKTDNGRRSSPIHLHAMS